MTTIPLQQAVVIFGDDELTVDGLRVRFKVVNSIGHDADDAIIQISNLSEGTSAAMRAFQDEQVELIVNGSTLDISRLFSVRDSGRGRDPTTTTTITLRDTRLHTIPIDTVISRHLGGLPYAIETLAALAIDDADTPLYVNVDTTGYEQGITVRGRFESFFDFLTQFNPPVPIAAVRNNGAFYIFTESGAFLANDQSRMHSDVLTYATPEEQETNSIHSVRADILLNHYVKIGDVMNFQGFVGEWRVIGLEHQGDTYGDDFRTRVTAIDAAYEGLLNPDSGGM